jgi:hypothetical protein
MPLQLHGAIGASRSGDSPSDIDRRLKKMKGKEKIYV